MRTFEVVDVERWIIWSERRGRSGSFDYSKSVVCGSLDGSLLASDLWCIVCVEEM